MKSWSLFVRMNRTEATYINNGLQTKRLRRRVFPRLIAPGGRAEGLEGSRFSIWLWTW